MTTRPSKDIRTNYASISALAKENPVAITVNGKENTVYMMAVFNAKYDYIRVMKRYQPYLKG